MEKVLSDYEKNGGTYHWEGDYLIPDLILPPETDNRPIGIWGAGVLRTPLPKAEAPTEPAGETRQHRDYLKNHRKAIYSIMLMDNTLHSYLADINEQADNMFSRLVKDMAKAEGITENLKAENQMEWASRMNNIYNRAMEIVNSELIYI